MTSGLVFFGAVFALGFAALVASLREWRRAAKEGDDTKNGSGFACLSALVMGFAAMFGVPLAAAVSEEREKLQALEAFDQMRREAPRKVEELARQVLRDLKLDGEVHPHETRVHAKGASVQGVFSRPGQPEKAEFVLEFRREKGTFDWELAGTFELQETPSGEWEKVPLTSVERPDDGTPPAASEGRE